MHQVECEQNLSRSRALRDVAEAVAPDTINKSNGEIGARNIIYAPVYLDLSSVRLRDIPSGCV